MTNFAHDTISYECKSDENEVFRRLIKSDKNYNLPISIQEVYERLNHISPLNSPQKKAR